MKTDIDFSGEIKKEIEWYIKRARKNKTRVKIEPGRPKYGLDAATAFYFSLQNFIVPTRHPILLAKIKNEAAKVAQEARAWGSDLAYGSTTWQDYHAYAKAHDWPEWLNLDVYRHKREITGDI